MKDIYISLFGKLTEIENSYDFPNIKTSLVDTTSYLWDWYANENDDILFLHGTPGSGKSSLVKMLAATLSAKTNGLVVFIELHRLHFSDKVTAFNEVKQYIIENYPWFFDESLFGKRLLILDGLDEIRYKPYANAKDLVAGVCQNNWNISCSVIISGRTQIIEYVSDETSYTKMELLPLYFQQTLHDIKLMQSGKEREIVKEDLRKIYWDKLLLAFHTQLEMPIEDDQFDELSDSPLLLFLVVWTLKHAGIEFKDLNSTIDLYDTIFQHVYTRAYNRGSLKESKNVNIQEYKGYQQMLRYLGGTAFMYSGRAISAKEIYDYCEIIGEVELCNEWIRTHKEDNPSKLVLLFFLREEQHKMNMEVRILRTSLLFL